MIIGLTGGIASGKSFVSQALAEHGVPVVDTDLIAREVVEPGSPALAEIHQTFGKVLKPDGSLDRQALGELVFQDPNKRKQLEAILHPQIRRLAFDRARQYEQAHAYVVMVVPLLFESGYDALLDRVLVVDVPEDVQLSRLIKRDRLSEAQAERIISTQIDRASRLKGADDVIDTSHPKSHILQRIEPLHQQYLDLAGRSD